MNATSTRRLEQEQLQRMTIKARIAQAQARGRSSDCPFCGSGSGIAKLVADLRAAREDQLPGIAATAGCDDSKKH
jgi:hypothetical protein